MDTQFKPTEEQLHEFESIEHDARQKLDAWWERIGQTPHYPCSTEMAAALLQAVEYKADLETIYRYISAGYVVPAKDQQTGRHIWMAVNVIHLATALEHRRMWQPFSPLHDHKKSQFERGQEIAAARGIEEPVCRDIDRYSVEDLLLFMRSADSQPVRDALYVAMKIKLEGIGRIHD